MELCSMAVRDGGSLVYDRSVQERLDEMCSHADKIGKREHLEEVLARLGHAFFFGKTARTLIFTDSCQYSLGFNVQVLIDGAWRFAMNGGLIYHQSAQEWSIHT